MPLSRVARVLDRPHFQTTFDLIRTVQTVVNGRAVNTPADPVTVSGVVTQGSGDQLVRDAQGERIQGNITIVSRTALVDGQGTNTADRVRWPSGSGRYYTVTLTSDYSQYGAGFYEAICTAEAVAP